MPRAPRQLPTLPPPNRANPTAGANSGLDKTWGQGQINAPFLDAGGTPDEYRAGIERAVVKGWLWRHESGVYVKFTPELFA
jgi:hypothetical protein